MIKENFLTVIFFIVKKCIKKRLFFNRLVLNICIAPKSFHIDSLV
jgi:hypothetical protein